MHLHYGEKDVTATNSNQLSALRRTIDIISSRDQHEFLKAFEEQKTFLVTDSGVNGECFQWLIEHCTTHNWVNEAQTIFQWNIDHGKITDAWAAGMKKSNTIEMIDVFLNDQVEFPYPASSWMCWRAESSNVDIFEHCLTFIVQQKIPFDMDDAVQKAAKFGHSQHLILMEPLMTAEHKRSAFISGIEFNQTDVMDLFGTPALRDEAMMKYRFVSHDNIPGMHYVRAQIERERLNNAVESSKLTPKHPKKM